jgi:hypothetical protein
MSNNLHWLRLQSRADVWWGGLRGPDTNGDGDFAIREAKKAHQSQEWDAQAQSQPDSEFLVRGVVIGGAFCGSSLRLRCTLGACSGPKGLRWLRDGRCEIRASGLRGYTRRFVRRSALDICVSFKINPLTERESTVHNRRATGIATRSLIDRRFVAQFFIYRPHVARAAQCGNTKRV